MSLHRYAAKRDGNEKALRQRAERNGWSVFQLSAKGFPDWLCVKQGAVRFVEVKSRHGRLQDAQEALFAALAKVGLSVYVVRTELEIDAVLPAQNP